MKLLMENWRKFVAETERTKNYGDLYLFENDSIQKVSFYDRFSTLNENEDDFEVFLEQWERSVDYVLNNLEEQKAFHYTAPKKKTAIDQAEAAVLETGIQAYTLLQRGGAAVGKVMNFAKKLKDKGNLGKVGGVILLGLTAGAAAIAINSLLVAGADPAEFQQAIAQIADAAGAVDPNVGQAVEQVAQNPEAALEVIPQLDQAVEQSAQQLSQVDNEIVQQMAQEAEKVSQQIPEKDEFAQMLDDRLAKDLDAAQQAGESGVDQGAEQVVDDIPEPTKIQKKLENIANKLFGPGSKYQQKWTKAFEIIDANPDIDSGNMNMPEFREFTKTLADQGVDKKTIRLVRKVWRMGKFNQFADAAMEAQGNLMDRVGAAANAGA
tara:strand:+ start:2405 stop:3541 length:1137 start_codon:yes stop_codon:yes gene_type:complete